MRVIAIGKNTDYKYAVRQMTFPPVVENLVTSQGMRLAIPNKHVFEKTAEMFRLAIAEQKQA